MNSNYTLNLADASASLEVVGGKGASLARMAAAGLPVPDGFHVTTQAYRVFIEYNQLQPRILEVLKQVDISHPESLQKISTQLCDLFNQASIPDEIKDAIRQAYTALPGLNPSVAVRSSATAEDLPESSFAGQQESYLNVRGIDEVMQAARKCWASLWTARAIGYRARQNVPNDQVALAIVVQCLVPADAAGILFTANPISGDHEQALINASWGLGESIVGGAVTPDNLTVEKVSGKILQREINDKQFQTVRVDGGTKLEDVPMELRKAPVLSDEQAADLCRLGVTIESLYGSPMDIEWALHDRNFAILQARPITSLPEVKPAPEQVWKMPDPKGRYMRASIVDLMPNPLSSLFATLGLSAIDLGIGQMSKNLFKMPLDSFTGMNLTINGYAYQSVSFSGKQWWLMLTRMVPAFPRMLRVGVAYWREQAHPHYKMVVNRWNSRSIASLSPVELMSGVDEILEAFGGHLGALMASTMGPSSGSEMLFTNIYQKVAKREGDPTAPTFLMGFENIPLRGEKALYDLAIWCREEPRLLTYLQNTTAEELALQVNRSFPPEEIPLDIWDEWRRRFRSYLDDYGYAIFDMDFANPLPMDEPGPILELLKLFIAGQGRNPYERQLEYVQRRAQAEESVRSRLKGIKRWAFEKALKWAQTQAPLREDGIAEIGLGYPVLRRMLHQLGWKLADAGAIEKYEDIFWLEEVELRDLVEKLESGSVIPEMKGIVQERAQLWKEQKRLTPPPQLPPGKKYMGIDMDGVLAGGEGSIEAGVIKGVAASPGQVTATARVLHGPEDFDQMQPGDILVAGITTPAWTPLFGLAAGVVTDIGGPLSHGSIVAREYGIPAVMGTSVATRYIRSGQTISVDGSLGLVRLENGNGSDKS